MCSVPAKLILIMVALAILHTPAQASNDGKLCDGWQGIAFCSGLMVVAGIASLVPEPPGKQVASAIQQGDADRFKLWIKVPDAMKAEDALSLAVSYYFSQSYHGQQGRQQIIEYLLDGMVDVSGSKMTPLLQTIIDRSPGWSTESLTLARLMFDHGASASGVDLNSVKRVPEELTALYLAHGATR